MLRKLVESESIEVEGRRYAAHYFEYRTARGARRYSCEIVIGGGERIIIDDDSLASLATRVTRLAPEVVQVRKKGTTAFICEKRGQATQTIGNEHDAAVPNFGK